MLQQQPNGIKTMNKMFEQKLKDSKIFVTGDYSIFKTIKGNRKVSYSHVARLTKSIMRKNMLPQNPIMVNENMEVIDGQHRLEVARANNLPVYYVIAPEAQLEDVQQLNITSKQWSLTDYLDSYVSQGLPVYKRFKRFLEDNEIDSVNKGLELMSGGGSENGSFKRGTFQMEEADWLQAQRRYDLWNLVKPYFIDRGYDRKFCIRAINVIEKSGHGDLLRQKLKNANPQLRGQFETREYLRMFEDVLNWKNLSGNFVRLY